MRIALIGAGNLATQLGLALYATGYEVTQVYSRTNESAAMLASKIQAEPTNDPKAIRSDADVYFLALKDEVLPSVLPLFSFGKGIVALTSGSLDLTVLSSYAAQTAVFYPLQTFSKDRLVSFRNIPIFIETLQPKVEETLISIAKRIGDRVEMVNAAQRMTLHVAAVFCCNFVNYLYVLSSDILKDENLNFKFLQPLIQETAAKIQALTPVQAQTGPAVRMDYSIIEKHKELLSHSDVLLETYNMLTKGIFERINHKPV